MVLTDGAISHFFSDWHFGYCFQNASASFAGT
ncbi:hypothetical protein J3A64_000187 [Pseudarthrobacter sp. PvP004]|nr:hypothetical protein [Pseudarthrobacter sp. PvP004]